MRRISFPCGDAAAGGALHIYGRRFAIDPPPFS